MSISLSSHILNLFIVVDLICPFVVDDFGMGCRQHESRRLPPSLQQVGWRIPVHAHAAVACLPDEECAAHARASAFLA